MKSFLALFLALLLLVGPAAPVFAAQTYGSIQLEALPGAQPSVHVHPPTTMGHVLVRALSGGQPIDALRLVGDAHADLPAFCCLLDLGGEYELRFRDESQAPLRIPEDDAIRLQVLALPALDIEIEAGLDQRLTLFGAFGAVDSSEQPIAVETVPGAMPTPAPTRRPLPRRRPTEAPIVTTPIPTVTWPITPPPTLTPDPCLTGHAWGGWLSDQNGRHSRVCNNDDSHEENQACAYGEPAIIAATCEKDGSKVVTCGVCGYVKSEVIPALGHAWPETYTSDQAGKHSKVCAHDATHIDSQACAYGEPVVTAATCEADGSKAFTCGVCQHSYSEPLPALGHAYGAWAPDQAGDHIRVCAHDASHVERHAADYTETASTAATCTVDGSRTLTCDVCGYSKTELIPAGHTWPATANRQETRQVGSYLNTYDIFVCALCGEEKEELVQSLYVSGGGSSGSLNTPVPEGTPPPTVIGTPGSNEGVIPAGDQPSYVVPATCTSAGAKYYGGTAANNYTDATRVEVLPQLLHDMYLLAGQYTLFRQNCTIAQQQRACRTCATVFPPDETIRVGNFHTWVPKAGSPVLLENVEGYPDGAWFNVFTCSNFQIDTGEKCTVTRREVVP